MRALNFDVLEEKKSVKHKLWSGKGETSPNVGVGDGGGREGTCPPSPPKKKIGKNIFRAIVM